MRYKLKDIFDLQMGRTPSRDKKDYWNTNDNKWISIADLTKSVKYVTNTKEYISDSAVIESGIKIIPAKTVVMSFKLSIGKTAITSEDMYSNEAIMAFHDKHVVELLPDYIYYMFKYKKWDNGSNTAVKGKTLNKAILLEHEIEICSLEKQKYIVKILDKVSSILEDKNHQLALLDELVKARFVEMFGGMDYPSIPLIDTVKKGAGLSYGIVVSGENVEDGIPMIRPSDFKNGKLDLLNVYRVAADIEEKYTKTRLIGDEILVQVIGQPGQVMLATNECRGMNVTRNLAVIRPNHEIINRIYLKEFIEKEDSQQILLKNTKQSTLKQLPLNLLKQLEVQVPPMKLQNQFADFVREVDKSRYVSGFYKYIKHK